MISFTTTAIHVSVITTTMRDGGYRMSTQD